MAAPATATRDKEPLVIVQPPTYITADPGYPSGPTADMDDETLFDALTHDTEMWASERCAAEAGRSLETFRVWVRNFYAAGDDRQRPKDDRTFIAPEGYIARSPYWKAGKARAWMMQNGIMDRRGVAKPFKPAGRPKGSVDRVPRQRTKPLMRDTAPKVLAAYRQLLDEQHGDREAREILATRLGLTRRKVARRITTAEQMEREQAGTVKPVDNAALLARFHVLMRQHVSEAAARAALAAETGLTRRQLAARLQAATAAGETPAEPAAGG